MLFLRLSPTEKRILQALVKGWTLKSHRYLDGQKIYQLHALSGETETVGEAVVMRLMKRRLLYTNHKFPAGTYLLTDKGRKIAGKLSQQTSNVLGTHNYFTE